MIDRRIKRALAAVSAVGCAVVMIAMPARTAHAQLLEACPSPAETWTFSPPLGLGTGGTATRTFSSGCVDIYASPAAVTFPRQSGTTNFSYTGSCTLAHLVDSATGDQGEIIGGTVVVIDNLHLNSTSDLAVQVLVPKVLAGSTVCNDSQAQGVALDTAVTP
jgi:hypothetical protein